LRDSKFGRKGLKTGMQSLPTLETRNTGCGKSFSASFLVAVLSAVAICAGLGLITVQIHRAMTAAQANPEPIAVDYTVPLRKKLESEANLAPERMITVSNGPSFARMKASAPIKTTPKFTEVPDPQPITKEQLVLEELNLEDRFEEKEETREVKAIPKIAKKSPSVRRSSPTQAELAEREKARLAGEVTQQASLVKHFTPHYPLSARRKGLEGRVVVTVTVGASGRVSACQISQSSGYASLDQSAVSAARRYRFFPAKNGLGQAVSVQKAIPFNFQLRS
jgi:protein TonB